MVAEATMTDWKSRAPRATVLAVLTAGLLAAGCSAPAPDRTEDGTTSHSSTAPAPSATTDPSETTLPSFVTADLTITVDVTGNGSTQTLTLTCTPEGGTHPDPEAACEALTQAGGAGAFAPTPQDRACTDQWGGPQVATVEGTVDSERVDAHFSRTDGCEISRWDSLSAVFGVEDGLL